MTERGLSRTRARRPRDGGSADEEEGRRQDGRFFTHANRAVAVGVALLACVALMAVLIPTGPLGVDESWSEAMRDIETPALKHLALLFNAVGLVIGRVVLVAIVVLVLLAARRWLSLVAFAVAEGLTPLLSASLKALVGRPRPPDGLIHVPGAGFPSGHAAYAGVTVVALVLVFTAPGPARRLWWAVVGLGVVGMAWSRTYLQVHWLSDVVAGSLLGIGVSSVVFGAAQLWLVRRRGVDRERLVSGDSTER
jgi:undecaprenyl-diphosphatase